MEQVLKNYLTALEKGDVDWILSLFEPDGWVQSPLLGKMAAPEFFPKVMEASSESKLTIHDILVSSKGRPRAVAYFLYEWRLKDGT